MSDFDLSRLLETLSGRKKPVVHELKWKIPESRSSAPLEDAETAVAQLRKLCAFKSGGEYYDSVYTKEYGDGVFAYFLVRTDKRTEKETLVFDGYMVQEEDEKLGFDLETGFEMMKNLASMGYKQEFAREVTEWHFSYHLLSVSVFDIVDFGAFVQVSMPATKIEGTRRLAESGAPVIRGAEEILHGWGIVPRARAQRGAAPPGHGAPPPTPAVPQGTGPRLGRR